MRWHILPAFSPLINRIIHLAVLATGKVRSIASHEVFEEIAHATHSHPGSIGIWRIMPQIA